MNAALGLWLVAWGLALNALAIASGLAMVIVVCGAFSYYAGRDIVARLWGRVRGRR